MKSEFPPRMTLEQTCAFFGIKKTVLYAWRKTGILKDCIIVLPGSHGPGGRGILRFDRDKCQRILDRNTRRLA